MAGLIKNNQGFLNQWHELFDSSIPTDIHTHTHWQKVEQLGLPTCKHANWNKTQLNSLLAHNFTKAIIRPVSVAKCDSLSITFDAYRLVFIDGRFAPALSDYNTGQWQVKVEQSTKRQPLPAPIYSEVFLHLTESLSSETTRIRLAASEIAQKPLYLLHISQANDAQNKLNILHYRHHIEIEHNAKGQIIEHFVSLAQPHFSHFSGARMTINVSDHAHFSHLKLACEKSTCYHFAHNDITIGNDAIVHDHTFILSSGMTRHQTSLQLNGERSDVLLKSLRLPANQDISDIFTYLEHNKGYCLSRQLHKVIAFDSSKGFFNGLIKVAKHAFKTDGKMINNNLLLGKLAKVSSKPELEIYTDDVKCSHGATVGYINDEQMFYLRSRGLTHKDAQQTIISAFAKEIVDTIGHQHQIVSDIVLKRISEILQNNLVTL
ncbi:Fe-S cluster assembly protein SufD [Candidatus Palibaumannia cicadellinicola]|uniref:Iron-sulfur cluster assembly protein SufD n=1 Tax=Candidatus Palibaumannia cicadellinicola TaxID=186490 RepID=A0A088MYF5_9GAMM|nr:Fe-S cluster assembly protein SufD [Candidatus Baumannia cicadellinicola]AIN47380.1 Iron-sulfur cluster assembly protein SufD [Candidatus Baumannia cicadellinicola]